MRLRTLLHVAAAAALIVTAGCAAGDDGEPDNGAVDTAPSDDDGADDGSDVDDGESAGGQLDDGRPQAFTALRGDVTPAGDTADGEVSVTFGPQARDSIPFVVHNGTDSPVSRVEVSGRIVDASGETVTSGGSQGVQPNVIPPGGWGFGWVYANAQLPSGAVVQDVAVDVTDGLGDFENIVTLEVTELEEVADGFTGQISNPHDVEVEGPLSVVIACFDGDDALSGVFWTFGDRENVDAGGTSTFTSSFYEDAADCAGTLASASGYVMDF